MIKALGVSTARGVQERRDDLKASVLTIIAAGNSIYAYPAAYETFNRTP